MTRAQREVFDRAAGALHDLTAAMSAEDVAALLVAFVAGRPDMDEAAIDRLYSRMIRARLADRLGVAA